VMETLVRRGLVEPSAPLSNLMEWRPMQRTELSNAALRCVAALFMRGRTRPFASVCSAIKPMYACSFEQCDQLTLEAMIQDTETAHKVLSYGSNFWKL